MQDTSSLSRRSFLRTASRSLAGVALVGAYPGWLWLKGRRAALARRSAWAMGTSVTLTSLRDAESAGAVRAAFAALARVQDRLSAHDATSDLSVLNANAGSWMDAEEDLASVAAAAVRLGDLTGGALDVTVLPVMRRLGFLPDPGADAVKERIGYTHLRIDGGRVRLDEAGYGIDFGGIAKGYGVDEGVSALRREGSGAVLLEAGGDLFAVGRPEPDSRWTVGVRDPLDVRSIAARFEVEDEAVATSGTYFQRRMVDGRPVSHLIDPRTGASVDRILSATIVAREAMTADALATATAVMPPDEAFALVSSLPDTEGLWIYPDRSFRVTSGLAQRLEWV